MKNFARRIAIVLSATALSVGLMGATASPVHAAKGSADADSSQQARDTGWGGF